MSQPASINPRIIDGLYCEALVLSDEVRAAFSPPALPDNDADDDANDEDLRRVAMSCEALRATTRMMHAIAWLLNQRAYMMGEISEFQLRRHGRLPSDEPRSDPGRVALLGGEVRALIAATERFYARLLRLDQAWRQAEPRQPGAILALRERITQRLHR